MLCIFVVRRVDGCDGPAALEGGSWVGGTPPVDGATGGHFHFRTRREMVWDVRGESTTNEVLFCTINLHTCTRTLPAPIR